MAQLVSILDSHHLRKTPGLDKLLRYASRDYPRIMSHIHETSNRYPNLRLHRIKPFTLANLFVSNEVHANEEFRICCGALVELTCRALTHVDDLIDNVIPAVLVTYGNGTNNMTLQQDLQAKVLDNVVYYSELRELANQLVRDHMKRHVLSETAASGLFSKFVESALSMYEGATWQLNQARRNSLPLDLANCMDSYVDKIAGRLFDWAVTALRFYCPSKKEIIDQLAAAMYPFARAFQIHDDMMDISQDLARNQVTTAIVAIKRNSNERELDSLRKISNSGPAAMTVDKFSKIFPISYSTLDTKVEEAYADFQNLVDGLDFSFKTDDLRYMNRNYALIRRILSDKIFGADSLYSQVSERSVIDIERMGTQRS